MDIYHEGYLAMSVADAVKVKSSGVLSPKSASIKFNRNVTTRYIPFKDEPHHALEAVQLAKESPENNDWMLLQVKFTPIQVFNLLFSNLICRIDMSSETGVKLGFRVYLEVAADADAGLDLAQYNHAWLVGHHRLSLQSVPWLEGVPLDNERRYGDWYLLDAGTMRLSHDDEEMSDPSSGPSFGPSLERCT